MLASTSIIAVASLLTLTAAAPHRKPLHSFGSGLAKRTSKSDTVAYQTELDISTACVPQCKQIETLAAGCYDQDSCAPFCAEGMFDAYASCLNCEFSQQDATGLNATDIAEYTAYLNFELGAYWQVCDALHYSPLNQTDDSIPVVSATPTGTAEPSEVTFNVSATSLREGATVTITPSAQASITASA